MNKLKFIILISLMSFPFTQASAKLLKLPVGKGKCPALTFEGETDWVLKSNRSKGDRWVLLDASKKKTIARIDFGLANTDQKQMTEVESKTIKLGSFDVEKYTVTTSFPAEGEKATEGLITSYNYKSGKLSGLVVMSEEYDISSKTDQKIEKALSTLKLLGDR